MGRGEEKATLGTLIESGIQAATRFSAFSLGGAGGLYSAILAESAESPESFLLTAGALGSTVGGIYLGVKGADRLEGHIAETIDDIKPQFRKDGQIYLDSTDPFEVLAGDEEVEKLTQEQKEKVENHPTYLTRPKEKLRSYLYSQIESQEEPEQWVKELGFNEINGFQGRYRTATSLNGGFKTGYVDEDEEIFIQAPRNGDTFNEALEKVKTWKNNTEVLETADQYIDQILENAGTKEATDGKRNVLIDYEFLHKHEEILRDEVSDGIATPSENYEIVITEHNGDPFPVLVGEYNSEMLESRTELTEKGIYGNVELRKQVLGMYMDALIDEGLFQGTLGDYWHQETFDLGRGMTINMFYDEKTDTVGVTDTGEHQGKPVDLPDITIASQYDKQS